MDGEGEWIADNRGRIATLGRSEARKHATLQGHLEDAEQVALEAALEWYRQCETLPDEWEKQVFFAIRRRITVWSRSGQVTGYAAADGYERRRRTAEIQRQRLRATLNREPTSVEVAEAVNAAAEASRSNPRKQGALITKDEVGVFRAAVATAPDQMEHAAGGSVDAEVVVSEAVRVTLVKVREAYPDHMPLVARWIALTQAGDSPSISSLVADFGISRAVVVKVLRFAHEILGQQLISDR